MATPRERALALREERQYTPTPTPSYEIKSVCRRCFGHGVSRAEVPADLLSPSGRAHKAGAEGRTDCGIEVTGEWIRVA